MYPLEKDSDFEEFVMYYCQVYKTYLQNMGELALEKKFNTFVSGQLKSALSTHLTQNSGAEIIAILEGQFLPEIQVKVKVCTTTIKKSDVIHELLGKLCYLKNKDEYFSNLIKKAGDKKKDLNNFIRTNALNIQRSQAVKTETELQKLGVAHKNSVMCLKTFKTAMQSEQIVKQTFLASQLSKIDFKKRLELSEHEYIKSVEDAREKNFLALIDYETNYFANFYYQTEIPNLANA
ncbi:MAG: hypothetical protein RR140_01225 [Clostridia bacterium]